MQQADLHPDGAAGGGVRQCGYGGKVGECQPHRATRCTCKGDFCFLLKRFGLNKAHGMILADNNSPTSARFFAQSTGRCGDLISFEGADCAYYRITDSF